MHYVYIIYSKNSDRYYSGHSKNVDGRLVKHNKRHSAATKAGVPWQLKKKIAFSTKSEAIKAENWIKRMKSRRIIKQIIKDKIDLHEVITG